MITCTVYYKDKAFHGYSEYSIYKAKKEAFIKLLQDSDFYDFENDLDKVMTNNNLEYLVEVVR